MSKRMIIAAVLIGLLGLAFAGSALAADSAETTADEHQYCGEKMAGWRGGGMFGSDAISDLLGLTDEEIREQRIAGQSLVEIAAAQGISEEALVEAILAEMKTAMQARVDEGVLVQEQADLMLQRMEQRIVEMVNRTAGDYAEDGCANGEMGAGDGMMGSGGMGMYGGMMRYGGGMMGHGGMGMHGDHDDHDHDGSNWMGFARGMMGWGGMH